MLPKDKQTKDVVKQPTNTPNIGQADMKRILRQPTILMSLMYFHQKEHNKTYALQLHVLNEQEAQLMLTTGSTRLAVSRGQQIWYHSTCNI